VRAPTVLAVPAAALVGDDGSEVWVVEDGRAVRRRVELGLSDAEWTEIRQGLEAEDWVITDPPADLRPGQAVRVASEESASGDGTGDERDTSEGTGNGNTGDGNTGQKGSDNQIDAS